jgi:hypothetical protein
MIARPKDSIKNIGSETEDLDEITETKDHQNDKYQLETDENFSPPSDNVSKKFLEKYKDSDIEDTLPNIQKQASYTRSGSV